MPIALLLQEITAVLRHGVQQLSRWNQMAAMEELLLDRARGFFMVRWFGAGLPLDGLSVRIAIENIAALRQRYAEIMRLSQPHSPDGGANLLEPLAGFAGTLAGFALSPVAFWITLATLVSQASNAVMRLTAGLGLAGRPFFAPEAFVLLFGLGLPLSLLATPYLLATQRERLQQTYDVLGAVAGLLRAAHQFIDLLLGPRENIRNPLLRLVVDLADSLASLFPFLIGLFAIVITRFGPVLGRIAPQLQALVPFVNEVIDLITVIWDDFMLRLNKALSTSGYSPYGMLMRIIDTLMGGLRPMLSRFKEILSAFADGFTAMRGIDTAAAMTRDFDFTGEVTSRVTQIFTALYPVRLIMAFIEQIKGIIDHFNSLPPDTKPSGTIATAVKDWFKSFKPTTPFPELPLLPNTLVMGYALGGTPPDLTLADIDLAVPYSIPTLTITDETRAMVERARRFSSIFAPQRAALAAELKGKTPQEILEAWRQEARQRGAQIGQYVAELLPQYAAQVYTQLDAQFARLERLIFMQRRPAALQRQLPVRDLPETGELKPVVRALVIKAPRVSEEDARQWGERLMKALGRQRYPVIPAPTGTQSPPREASRAN